MLFKVYGLWLSVSLISTAKAAPQSGGNSQVNNTTSIIATSQSNNDTSNTNRIFEDIIESGIAKVRPLVENPKFLSIWADAPGGRTSGDSSMFTRVTILIDDPEKSEELILNNDPENPLTWPGDIERRPSSPAELRVKPWS